MAEVISWGSAAFSMGLDLYESGQVMSHDIHDILQKCPNHIPLLHSPLFSSHGSHTSSLRDESGALREGASWLVKHMSLSDGLVHSKYWYGNQESLQTANPEHGRGEEVCRGKSSVCWKWNWAEYLTFLTLLSSLVSVQVGFSLLRPSPDSPLVSGVDNPVGDTGQTVDSHRYFAFNWRLTSTYIPDQVLFSFGRRWVWLMWVSPAHTFSHTPAPHQLTWCTLIVSISRLPTRSSLISRPLALSSQLNNLKRINCVHLPGCVGSFHFVISLRTIWKIAPWDEMAAGHLRYGKMLKYPCT